MSQNLCFETICVENRQLKNAAYHDARLNKTRNDLWGYTDLWKLSDLEIPDFVTHERHKLRIAYSKDVEDVRWGLHTPRVIRKIKRVYDDEIDYSYKYDNRSALTVLYEKRGDADEILIIKNGMVTDSFYCNVAFLKDNRWHTPVTNLLPGTQRAFLLDSGLIQEAAVSEANLSDYSHIRLFNALIDWQHAPELKIGMII